MTVVEVTNAIVHPRAVVIWIGRTLRSVVHHHKAARTHPKHASRRAKSETLNPWIRVGQPIALSTMMRPWWFVFFTSPTIPGTTRELLDFVSLSSKKVGFLDLVSDNRK